MRKPGISVIWIILLILAVGIIPALTGNIILRETVFLILLYIALASSLNIILGYTGYVSFGHIVFYGIGGYTAFVLIDSFGTNIILAMIAGGVVAALVAYALGQAILKLRGAYFAIATIGVNEAVKALVENLEQIGGSEGIFLNVNVYKAYGGAENALWLSYYLMLLLTIAVILTSWYVKNSKFGLGLMAIREDEDAAIVAGVNTKTYKCLAYALSAFFPGMIGAIFFFKNGNIEPVNAFNLTLSIEMIFMVMLGGFGTVAGPIIGAIVYERIRGILLMSEMFKDLHMAISGVLLLLVILFMPRGIMGYVKDKVTWIGRYLE